MRQPDIDGLLSKVDSRYTLVVAAARRARQLIEGDPERVDAANHKPISIALREIAADEVEWSRAVAQPTADAPAVEKADVVDEGAADSASESKGA